MSDGFKFSTQLRPRVSGAGSSARGIQGREGLLFVSGNTEAINALLRDRAGRFATSGFARTAGLNRRLRMQLTDMAVEELDKQMIRPSVSTKRLRKAIRDERNGYDDQFGFGIGKPAFLDFSEAKYWRAIEQGTSFFVGRVISGVWGSSLSGQWRRGATGPWAVPKAPWTPFVEGGSGQKLYPMKTSDARRLLRSGDGPESRGGATAGIINKPITAKRYFQKAWRRFNARDRARPIIDELYGPNERRAPRKKR